MTRHDDIAHELGSRWPENRIAPSLGRVAALCHLLGDPQKATPVIHLTGTNGKGSTAIIIESLLRAVGLRVGRYSSPHLVSVNERIAIDGQPISDERFDDLWEEVKPFVAMVDEQLIDGIEMTFFEVTTAMAYAAFADAPVDVAVIEVGMGGSWDATNVADGSVAVVTPIALDHTHILGHEIADIAGEKAGIIKPGAHAVLAGQTAEAATVLLARCAEVGALAIRDGVDFGLLGRVPAVGGQVIRINAMDGPIGDLHLPVHGAHFAHNAALAVAAVEAFLGLKGLSGEVIQEGFDLVKLPGRMETVRTSPTIVLDAGHNPHGAQATAAALAESFAFTPLVGVVAAMSDKDIDGMLRVWEESMNQIVCTEVSSTSRGISAKDLGERAAEIFGPDRVHVAKRMDSALEKAVALADSDSDAARSEVGEGVAPGVIVTGSVIAVGEARALLVTEADPEVTTEIPLLEIGADEFGAGPIDHGDGFAPVDEKDWR